MLNNMNIQEDILEFLIFRSISLLHWLINSIEAFPLAVPDLNHFHHSSLNNAVKKLFISFTRKCPRFRIRDSFRQGLVWMQYVYSSVVTKIFRITYCAPVGFKNSDFWTSPEYAFPAFRNCFIFGHLTS